MTKRLGRTLGALAMLAAFALGVLATPGCGGAHPQSGVRPPGLTNVDGPSPSARIVSLAPSLTEIAYAIGCQEMLVADTTYDDYPAAAAHLPHVADLVNVDLERLSALHPTQVLALHDQEREAAPVESRLGVRVRYLPNRNLADLFIDIAGVGEACGMPGPAAELSHSLRGRIAAVARQAARYRHRPTVLFLLDLPGFTAGSRSFIDDLIRLAGGTNVAGQIREAYPNVGSEALSSMNPEVLIVAREVRLGPSVLAQEPWRSIAAVRDGRVVRPPSDDIVERNGPRVVMGLEWLVGVIHR